MFSDSKPRINNVTILGHIRLVMSRIIYNREKGVIQSNRRVKGERKKRIFNQIRVSNKTVLTQTKELPRKPVLRILNISKKFNLKINFR